MELKKGDMVEILATDNCISMQYRIGEVCEVKEVLDEDSTHDYAVYTYDKEDFWYFHFNQVKLAENKEEPTIETQKKQVFKHLQENSITSWEAISKYRITRLADVIYRLRKDHNITTEIVKENKKQWAKYTLIK